MDLQTQLAAPPCARSASSPPPTRCGDRGQPRQPRRSMPTAAARHAREPVKSARAAEAAPAGRRAPGTSRFEMARARVRREREGDDAAIQALLRQYAAASSEARGPARRPAGRDGAAQRASAAALLRTSRATCTCASPTWTSRSRATRRRHLHARGTFVDVGSGRHMHLEVRISGILTSSQAPEDPGPEGPGVRPPRRGDRRARAACAASRERAPRRSGRL